jgi:hypothetical protein
MGRAIFVVTGQMCSRREAYWVTARILSRRQGCDIAVSGNAEPAVGSPRIAPAAEGWPPAPARPRAALP